MFVRDYLPPIDFLEADCQTKIERLGLSVGPARLAAHRRDSEGEIGPSRDVHLLNVEADRIVPPRKEGVPGLPVSVQPNALEWRAEYRTSRNRERDFGG
jgi:hypothetical protein